MLLNLTTAQLVCRANLNVWIAAEFDWKFLSGEDGNILVDLSDTSDKSSTQKLFKFGIEMTLTKRRIPKLGHMAMEGYRINEELLSDDAFVPKTYSVCLERGNFLTQHDTLCEELLEGTPRWGARITFDRSPYPSRETWKEEPYEKFWEWKAFCAWQLEPTPAAKGICIVQ